MEESQRQRLIQEVLPDFQFRLKEVKRYDGSTRLRLRWPGRKFFAGPLAYDLVDFHKGETYGYVFGEETDDGRIAMFMLSSGEWAACLSPDHECSQFELIDCHGNNTEFRRVNAGWNMKCESNDWTVRSYDVHIAIRNQSAGTEWVFHRYIHGDENKVDLGSFIWPVDPKHGLTIAGLLGFSRMWLVPSDFD